MNTCGILVDYSLSAGFCIKKTYELTKCEFIVRLVVGLLPLASGKFSVRIFVRGGMETELRVS